MGRIIWISWIGNLINCYRLILVVVGLGWDLLLLARGDNLVIVADRQLRWVRLQGWYLCSLCLIYRMTQTSGVRFFWSKLSPELKIVVSFFLDNCFFVGSCYKKFSQLGWSGTKLHLNLIVAHVFLKTKKAWFIRVYVFYNGKCYQN